MLYNLHTENTSEGETGNQADEPVIPADMADQEVQDDLQVAELPVDGKKRITKILISFIIHGPTNGIAVFNYLSNTASLIVATLE